MLTLHFSESLKHIIEVDYIFYNDVFNNIHQQRYACCSAHAMAGSCEEPPHFEMPGTEKVSPAVEKVM